MWKATVRGLFARKVRLTLTALAIVLGVAFVSGTPARKPWKTPVRLMAMSRDHSSSVVSWMWPIVPVPALLKRSDRPLIAAAATA